MITDKISVIVTAPENGCLNSIERHLPHAEVVAAENSRGIRRPELVNKLAGETEREWVLFTEGDAEIEPELWGSIPEDWWGVVYTGKGYWMAHKKMLDILPDNQFLNDAYLHCFCDDEMMDIAREAGRWMECKTAGPPPVKKGISEYERDKATYIARKRERLGKVAIGFPLVDDRVPVGFFTSFSCMEKPREYTLLMPKFPHGPYSGSIADARNSLVEQAQMEGARYLLMLDTDQVYPPETLTKLLSHKVDVCGVRVHRRWMPFDPIFLRGDIGSYKSVSEEEMYSGDLIDVDATGTGCLLFDMTVFDKVDYPWFKLDIQDNKPVGEDIYFCSKARKAGVRICVDTAIEVGHLTTIEVNRWLHKICQYVHGG